MLRLFVFAIIVLGAQAHAQGAVSSSEVIASLSAKCEAGALEACSVAGVGIMASRTGERDIPLAGRHLKRSCEGGDAQGCRYLGLWFVADDNPAANIDEGFRLLSGACSAGISSACREAAGARIDPSGNTDQSEVLLLYRKACDADDPDGCALAGMILDVGRGVQQDRKAAFPLLDKACRLGDADSCAALGIKYFNGSGVKKDVKRATAYADRACALGYEDKQMCP